MPGGHRGAGARGRAAAKVFSRRAALLAAALALVAAVAVDGTVPIARHHTVVGTVNQEVVLRLLGYDADGDVLTTTVVELPSSSAGHIYQLSHNYNLYGFEPKYHTSGLLSSANTQVTGNNARLIWRAPNTPEPDAKWGWLKYQVHDGSSNTVRDGIVALMTSSGALLRSTFSDGVQGWTVVDNGAGGVGVSHEPSSRGSHMNYYVYSKEDEIRINTLSGDDMKRWYFVAPSTYHASTTSNPTNLLAYGGSLDFSLASQSGDFSSSNMNSNLDLVIMECRTCAHGMGMKFVRRLDNGLSFDGKEKAFSIPLTASGGHWLKDPKNTLLAWSTPTECEMVEMLDGLSDLRILGDFTRWHESVSLDNVAVKAGAGGIPMSCY